MYNAALKEGLYQNRYAGSNRREYWAEGVGSWFNGPHRDNVAHTRLALKKYDPRLAKLLTEVLVTVVGDILDPRLGHICRIFRDSIRRKPQFISALQSY